MKLFVIEKSIESINESENIREVLWKTITIWIFDMMLSSKEIEWRRYTQFILIALERF